MAPEARTPSVLPGEDRTTGANQEEHSARAGCTKIAVSRGSPDRERRGEEDAEQGGAVAESTGQPSASAGEEKLRGFLQDLVEQEGRAEAAERLGVSERTVRRALVSPQLSPFMTESLQRQWDQVAVAREPVIVREPANLPEQLRKLARRLAELEEIADAQLDELWEVGHDLRQIRDAYAPEPVPGTEGRLAADGMQRRTIPGLVTVVPLPDDGDVFGEALPVVAEWRRTLRALDEPPDTLAWIGMTERLLRLEIQLIDDRQLTLPPAEGPWDDVRRENELQLRQHRLKQLRVQRLWTEPLHWTARLVTLGRWGRGESLEQQMQREFEARREELLAAQGDRRRSRRRHVSDSGSL